MDPSDSIPAKPKRRAQPRTVIEAVAAPMPVVEAAPAEVPVEVFEAAPVIEMVADATPTAAAPANTPSEDIMDTTETVTQAQTLFADAGERARGAMEKGVKLVDELGQFNKGNVEALVESGRIAARGFEALGRDAAAYAKTSWEQSTAAWQQLAAVKSPTEFLKIHGELVRQSFDQMVAQGSRSTETVLKLAGEIAQPISNRFAVAAEKVKVAA